MSKVKLRAMEPEDLDFLYNMENDHEVWNVGNTSVPYSRYVLHDYIANASNDIYHDGQVRLIVDNEEGDTVGMVDIFDFNAQHRRAEISIVISRLHRRCGYAEATIAQIIDYSLRTLHLNQLYAIVAEDNVASRKLFEKMKFTHSSTLKKWLFDGRNYADAMFFQRFL